MNKIILVSIITLITVICGYSQPVVLNNSTTSLWDFAFGGMQVFPNTGYRYAEGYVVSNYTSSLAHPTYLNIVHQYSQISGSCDVKVYISTSLQSTINVSTDPHFHVSWWNASSANLGYYVGQFTSTWNSGIAILTSFNIESWIATHPASKYYILFDQQNNSYNECIYLAWLGPQGVMNDIIESSFNPTILSNNVNCLPNPTVNSAEICYSVTNTGSVSIKIVDCTGKVVRDLYSGIQTEGTHSIIWNCTTNNHRRASSGTYFFEVLTADSKSIGKIVLH